MRWRFTWTNSPPHCIIAWTTPSKHETRAPCPLFQVFSSNFQQRYISNSPLHLPCAGLHSPTTSRKPSQIWCRSWGSEIDQLLRHPQGSIRAGLSCDTASFSRAAPFEQFSATAAGRIRNVSKNHAGHAVYRQRWRREQQPHATTRPGDCAQRVGLAAAPRAGKGTAAVAWLCRFCISGQHSGDCVWFDVSEDAPYRSLGLLRDPRLTGGQRLLTATFLRRTASPRHSQIWSSRLSGRF